MLVQLNTLFNIFYELLNDIYKLNWFTKSCIVALGFVPFIIGVPIINKLGLSVNYVLIGWSAGIVLFLLTTSAPEAVPTKSVEMVLFVSVIFAGFVLGGPTNALMGQAYIEAPNPGVPAAITGAGPVLAMITLLLLACLWPRSFADCEVSWTNVLGIAIMAVGLGLALYRDK